ncbi:MAG: DNA-deoxyinosine glycosylase [Ruminococcaceae bacterium]|nr:DNA-deoxyinosine glycosylase [Oscillospiraceae bacterium]
MVNHPIPPVFNNRSRVLILGSFPSVKSREAGFFYGHSQNRFWRVLSAVLDCPEPRSVADKKQMLLDNRIALWDVIASCEITGSADSTIKNVVPNDLSVILGAAPIETIFVNGKTAEKYYNKYIRDKICRDAVCLPSTSPANAAWGMERLTEAWRVIVPKKGNLMICDLHAHSNRSDGTLTPTALAAAAKEAGLSAIALTDHNTVAGLPEFIKACEALYMEAVPGVEISTEYEGVELHILGLYIPETAFAEVENYVAQYNVRKEKSNRALVGRLREAGYLIDYDEIVASTPDGHINRAHIAKALLDKGYVDSVKIAFSTLLGEGKGFYVPPERVKAPDAVAFLKSIGAVPVWAHPFLQMDEDGARKFLSEAVPLGLVGMETRYSLYDTETEALADRLIEEFGILPSGGSDFHGEVKPDIKLGVGKGNLRIPLTFAHDLRSIKGEKV